MVRERRRRRVERVDLASQGRVEVLAADFYMNGTVHAGVAAPVSDQVRKLTRIQPKNKVYLTLTFGEGDNMQYCQRRMREIWDDPRRGEAPVDWTVSPLLSDIGPGLLSYYRTGMDLVYAYNYRENNQWVPFSEALGRSYADLTPVRGIIQSWETGDLLVDRGGIPVIGNFSPAGKAAEYKAALVAHIAGWDG
jgi:hypothetical protein